jgi:hypothetical protein
LEANFEEAKNDPNIDPEIREKLTIEVREIKKTEDEPSDEECVNDFVKSITGIITITVVTVLRYDLDDNFCFIVLQRFLHGRRGHLHI